MKNLEKLIKWKIENSVHVKEFDEQHKKLFKLINELYHAINTIKVKDELEGLLSQFMDYCNYHFANEEKYFDKFDYPEKKSHKAIHDGYNNKISLMQKQYKNNELEISFELIDFLEDWWIGHINNVDKKYSKFFNDHGLS